MTSTNTAKPTDPSGSCDVAVVGGGILGLAVAREITKSHPRLRVTVLEKESQVGLHQTSHNSGVIHAGIYYKPGSFKARLCASGARELYDYCVEHGIPVDRCGKVVVATSEHEVPRLDELERRGVANGVRGLRRCSPAELAEIEPHARGVSALHSPETAIVDFAAVARSMAGELLAAGQVVATGCEVRSLRPEAGRVRVVHGNGETSARAAIACAGLWADRLAAAAGAERDPVIVPFRGAYLRIRPERRHLVRSLIYPVPDPELPFLGVHLTRCIDGEVLVGPTALLAGARDAYRLRRVTPQGLLSTLTWVGSWRMARRWWRSGVGEIHRAVSRRALVTEARRLLPELAVDDVLSGPAGVRAQAVGRDGKLMDDFVLSRTERVLHVRNAPSPAATSALALARVITDQAIEDMGLGAESKATGSPSS